MSIKLTGLGFTSSTALTGTVPAGLPIGAYDVMVANPDGSTGILPGGFMVSAIDVSAISSSSIWHSEVSDYIYILTDSIIKLGCSIYPDFLMIEAHGGYIKFLNTSKTDGTHTQIYPYAISVIDVSDGGTEDNFVVIGDNVYVTYAFATGKVKKYSLTTGALLGTVSGFGCATDSNSTICTDGTYLYCVASTNYLDRLIRIDTSLNTTTYDRATTGTVPVFDEVQADANNIYVYYEKGPGDHAYISKLTKTNTVVSTFEVDHPSAGSEFKTDGTNHYVWTFGTTDVKKYTTAGTLVSTFTFNTTSPSLGGVALKR